MVNVLFFFERSCTLSQEKQVFEFSTIEINLSTIIQHSKKLATVLLLCLPKIPQNFSVWDKCTGLNKSPPNTNFGHEKTI